ncbi:cilia- and flagella-associated protein 36-like [Stegodyphus dumicola]|uniref:cilia- and flagella-associated protein 36-like n=1 Tax=Stegodyphus dumicola TaxID=202533 RepID=UPI0015B13DA9|nr:cilia- and flagella-associated protein 36-like [Stegodyphus dumicola]
MKFETAQQAKCDAEGQVDTLLGSHMEDLGISPEEFDKACSESEKNIHSQFRKSLFEQLWAADDYEIFKRMMMQKNLELQLQALDLLAHQFGLLPESFLPGDDYEPSPQEKSIMETVVKRYVEENAEEADADHQSEQKEVIQETKARLEEERKREIKLMEKAIETSLHDSPKAETDEKPLEIMQRTEVSPEEARRRQEYLKQQRDKLLALKKQEREKLLQRYEETSPSRPKSARAAQRAVQEEKADSTVDPKVLAFRKSLAARLKAEVVDQK